MTRLRLMTLIGTRPEAIKMVPAITVPGAYPDRIASYVCTTAQHRNLLYQVLDVFTVRPEFDLDLMQPNQSLSQLTAKRAVTERPGGVAAGVVKLVGTDEQAIVEAAVELLNDAEAYDRLAQGVNPYGNDRASRRLVKVLCDNPVLAPPVQPAETPTR